MTPVQQALNTPHRLDCINLTCQRGQQTLFAQLNCSVKAGELLWVRGANGSGKTSLLRILAGLSKAETGEVQWNQVAINQAREAYQQALQWVGHSNGFCEQLSAVETLLFEMRLRGEPVTEQQVVDALYSAGLKGRCDLPLRALSQGQKKRAALARLVLGQKSAKIWILDEPFTALDQVGAQWLHQLIADFVAQGGQVIVTAHDQTGFQVPQCQSLWLNEASVPEGGAC